MGYADYLTGLLRPLGVYDLENGVFGMAELESEGAALDDNGAKLDQIAREMLVCTAEDAGLEKVEELLPYRPVTERLQRRRDALAALLRIGGDSFTLEAINDNLAGCGLNARAAETDMPGYVQVSFPEVPGIPDGYEEMCRIIEDILPCHLGIEYVFWYVTWEMLETRFGTWGNLEAGGYTWETLEKLVKEMRLMSRMRLMR